MRAYLVYVAVLYALLPASALAQGGGFPANVTIVSAELSNIAPQISVSGTVISRDDARLAAEVAGNLVSIAEIGSVLETGAIVAKIEDGLLLQQEAENEGLVASRRARIAFLEREVERLRRLAAQNNAARSALDQTESDLSVSRSDLLVAQARLQQIRIGLYRTEIRTPFAGRVTQRFVNPGEHVAVGAAVVRVVSTDRLEVVMRAPLKSVGYLHEGDDILVNGDRNSGLGVVRTMVPFGDARTHMFELRVDIPPQPWIIGESVRVIVPTDVPRKTLAVPRDALILRADGTAVFRINSENKAERVPVEIGATDGESIAIISGDLNAGDRVVIRGGERLRPGQDVNITNIPGGSGAQPSASN